MNDGNSLTATEIFRESNGSLIIWEKCKRKEVEAAIKRQGIEDKCTVIDLAEPDRFGVFVHDDPGGHDGIGLKLAA